MKAALYARVSTEDKDQNPETQLYALRKYCDENGVEVYQEYVDYARAKDYRRRKRWDQLLKDMRRRLFNTILVYKLDRMSREARYTLNIHNEMQERNIRFVSITQDIDTSNTGGRMFFYMLAIWAETESGFISDRVKSGIERYRAEGNGWGRKPLNISREKVLYALEGNAGNKTQAARQLGCSRAYINRVLKGEE